MSIWYLYICSSAPALPYDSPDNRGIHVLVETVAGPTEIFNRVVINPTIGYDLRRILSPTGLSLNNKSLLVWWQV